MSRARRVLVNVVSFCAVASGVTALWRFWRRRGEARLFILEYHDVSVDGKECEGTISPKRLRRHLRYLKGAYRLVTLSQATAQLNRREGLSEDLVVVTFDDGYAGNFEAAWPVLAEEDVPATVFLTSGFLDGGELWFDFARRALHAAARQGVMLPEELRSRLAEFLGSWPFRGLPEQAIERLKALPPKERERLLDGLRAAKLRVGSAARPMTWGQVREMQAAGIEMGGHTVSHPILSSLSAELQEHEISACRERIAAETGRVPVSFAFPNGDYNETTLEILRRHGYAAACTTLRGSNRSGCDPLTLRRIGVGSDPTWVLAARLSGLFDDEVRRWIRA